jgi:hypothetical protein
MSNRGRFQKPARGFYDKSAFQKDFQGIIQKHEKKQWFMRAWRFLRSNQWRYYRRIIIFGIGSVIMMYYLPGSTIIPQKWLKKGVYSLKLTLLDLENSYQEAAPNPMLVMRSVDS